MEMTQLTKVTVIKDERYPVYDLFLNTQDLVSGKELELPLEQLQEYMSIQGKYYAMQNAIEELYNEQR